MIIRTCHFLCKRPRCYHSTIKTQVAESSFKLNPIHASVIYQIPWIHWISDPFRENSIAMHNSVGQFFCVSEVSELWILSQWVKTLVTQQGDQTWSLTIQASVITTRPPRHHYPSKEKARPHVHLSKFTLRNVMSFTLVFAMNHTPLAHEHTSRVHIGHQMSQWVKMLVPQGGLNPSLSLSRVGIITTRPPRHLHYSSD